MNNQQLSIRKIMKNLLLFSFLTLAFSFTACNEKATGGSATHPEFMLNEAFELGLGNTMQLKGTDYTITFTEVTQDSRCPEGVNCIRAGEIIFTVQTKEGTRTLTKQAKKELTTTLDNYKVTVTEVTPYPKNGVQMDRTSYAIKMTIQ